MKINEPSEDIIACPSEFTQNCTQNINLHEYKYMMAVNPLSNMPACNVSIL